MTVNSITTNRRLLWVAAIGLWVIGCVIIAIGAGIWWNRRGYAREVAVEIPPAAPSNPDPTEPPPTETPKPTLTPVSTPTVAETEQSDSSTAKDAIKVSSDETPVSAGDTLARPTATPAQEGIILFLSSRDHVQTEEKIRDRSGAHEMELYAMRADGSRQTRLSDGALKLTNYPPPPLTSYSINGQIVIRGTDIFDLKTRQVVEKLAPTQVVDGRPLKIPGGSSNDFVALQPAWSQDGEMVFFGGVASDGFSLYYLKTIGDAVQRLTVAPDESWGDRFPAWSPDGEQIVFDRQWHDKNQDGLWIMSKDGSELRRLVVSDVIANGTHQSSWSPDGKTIAYEGPKENTQHYYFELWAVDVAGRKPRQLTHLPENQSIWGPVWSPDSRQIAFTMAPGGTMGSQADVYAINASGGEPRQLTFEGYTNLAPLWLPLDAGEILAGGDTPLLPTPQPISKPTPVKSTNCPSPDVQIASPAPGTRFTRRNNFIVGTANISRFHHWRIEYSTDPNGGWNYLLERDYPVDNDKLVMIDAGTVPNGPYGLRLTVVDETGNYPEPCEVWFVNVY